MSWFPVKQVAELFTQVAKLFASNTYHLLAWLVLVGGCIAISYMAVQVADPVIALPLSVVIAVLIGFCTYFIGKFGKESVTSVSVEIAQQREFINATFNGFGVKMASLADTVGDMQGSLREVKEQLFMFDLSDPMFTGEAFERIWQTLTLNTKSSFLAMSYMKPEAWCTPMARLQLKVLGVLIEAYAEMDITLDVRRVFVIETLEELPKLEDKVRESIKRGIGVRWILRTNLIDYHIMEESDVYRGFNLSDGVRGAIYRYTEDRTVDAGKLLCQLTSRLEYKEVFEKAWVRAKKFDLL